MKSNSKKKYLKILANIRVIAKSPLIFLLTALPLVSVNTCPSCPLAGTCPVRLATVTYTLAGIGSILPYLRRKLQNREKLLVSGLIFICIFITLASVIASSPGADSLHVSPSIVQVAPGSRATIEVRVDFAHRQPCPYSDWKILYEVAEGDIQVVEATKPSVESRSATMTLTIEARSNGTLLVIYKYGTGCPYGDEEKAEVKVIVLKETPSETQPQPAEEQEPEYLTVAKAMYDARGAILLALALASITAMLVLSRHCSNPPNPRHRSRKLTITREVVIASVFVFFVLIPVAVSGSICPCMIGALQEGVLTLVKGAALSEVFSNLYLQVLLASLLVSIIVGRLWCGWLCPVGVVQDYLARLYGKIRLPSGLDRYLSGLKYLVLAVTVAFVALSQTYWYCLHACIFFPLTSAIRFLNFSLSPLLAAGLLVLVLSILIPRFFCKYLCPYGALLELMSKANLRAFRITSTEKCRKCKVCVAVRRVCPMGLERPGSAECISCGKCIENCPFGAVSLKHK